MLVFLVNPGSQWAGDTVVNYKMTELEELPEVQMVGYSSWERTTEGEDVLRVFDFRMTHDLVDLKTQQIEAPLFSDWVKIGFGQAYIPGREMVWTFDALEADYLDERRGTILRASVTSLTYEGAPFTFETQEDANLNDLYSMVAQRFELGDLGDMRIELLDAESGLELTIGWILDDGFELSFKVLAEMSYREFRRQGYEAEFWNGHVNRPVLVSIANPSEQSSARTFEIDWAARPNVFEPLIELVLREVPDTLDSIKG